VNSTNQNTAAGEAASRQPPMAGTRYDILYQILNFLSSTTAASQYDADLRQPLILSRTENLATVALAFRGTANCAASP
jgi:hypothetical protein